MSQENVEVIVGGFRRFEAGDDRWTEYIHPDVEWDLSAYPLADLPTRGSGRERYLETVSTYFSGWLDYKQEIKETIDAGDEVIVVVHETARLRDSETTIERDSAHVWTVRDGKVARWRVFEDRQQALEAAGLEE